MLPYSGILRLGVRNIPHTVGLLHDPIPKNALAVDAGMK
jgi:hypothetical protein